MKRELVRSTTFARAAKKVFKRHPDLVESLVVTLNQLADDAYEPSLKTHKLKGDLDGRCSCSVAYDLRIVFRFVKHQDKEAILLLTIGSHDEVY